MILGPPYPGPPPRAPHLPLDNTRIHPSYHDIVYKKPFETNEIKDGNIELEGTSSIGGTTTTTTESNQNKDNDESGTIKQSSGVNPQPPTIIVVQQPHPQTYLQSQLYGNGYQVFCVLCVSRKRKKIFLCYIDRKMFK